MRGKYGIRVYGETYVAFSTREMLEWVGLFQQHDAGSDGDAFAAATTMTVLRIKTIHTPWRENDTLTTTSRRVFTRPQPAKAPGQEEER